MANHQNNELERVAAVGQALGDPARVRAVAALAGGELCVCQLVELLDLAPSTVSRHLAVLHHAGLIVRRKAGRWHYYRLPVEAEANGVALAAIRWTIEAAGAETRALRSAAEACAPAHAPGPLPAEPTACAEAGSCPC